jgi:RHS repeat-associated protein
VIDAATPANVTAAAWDSLGRKLSETDPDLGTRTYAYDLAGNLTKETDPRGQAVSRYYDQLHRLTRKIHPNGDAYTWTFDETGHGAGIGRATTLTYPAGTESLSYDFAGRATSHQMCRSGTCYTMAQTFDATGGGRLASTIFPDETVSYGYDATGSVSSASGYATSVLYDARGNVTSLTYANGAVTTRTFDANRFWLAQAKTVMGSTTLLQLDYVRADDGQITQVTEANPTATTRTFAYDSLHRLTSVGESAGGTTLFNDTFATLNNWTLSGCTTAGKWQLSALHSATGYPGSGSGSQAAGSAICSSSPSTMTSSSISLNGQTAATLTFLRFADSAFASTDYLKVELWNGTSWVQAFNWTGGAGDDDTWHQETVNLGSPYLGRTDFQVRFTCKSSTVAKVCQIDDVKVAGGGGGTAFAQTLGYDAIGNITSNSLLSPTAYVYGDALHKHGVTGAGGQTYVYDAAGNVTAGGGRVLLWDAEGRMTQATKAGVTSTYAYDAGGQRVRSSVGGGVTTYYFGKLLEKSGTDLIKYVFVGDTRIARRVGTGAKSFYHTDHLSSVRAVTDDAGLVVKRYDFRPFGAEYQSSGTLANVIRFTDHHQDDETGLTYMNARYYDPVLSRFISADTAAPDPLNPQDLNRYSYVLNNPVMANDPTGHEDEEVGVYRDEGDYACGIHGDTGMFREGGVFASAERNDLATHIACQYHDSLNLNGRGYPVRNAVGAVPTVQVSSAGIRASLDGNVQLSDDDYHLSVGVADGTTIRGEVHVGRGVVVGADGTIAPRGQATAKITSGGGVYLGTDGKWHTPMTSTEANMHGILNRAAAASRLKDIAKLQDEREREKKKKEAEAKAAAEAKDKKDKEGAGKEGQQERGEPNDK